MLLYRLGGFIDRTRVWVVAAWLLLLTAVVGTAAMLGTHYDDSFSIPGTQSQQGQDVLADRFGLTGTNGQILYTSTGGPIASGAAATAVGSAVKAVDAVDGVAVSNPLTADDPLISADKRSTIAQVRFASKTPSETTLDRVQEAARPQASAGVKALVGGDAYKSSADPSRVPELLGLLVSFFILAVTLGSLTAAGMPILSSLVGVGVTLSAVVVTTSAATVSSSAPTLAEMLGLAVGIDYALFLLSRHRQHLREGLPPAESMSRALATAGSAVVFAGTTVVIALVGLSVARIPVLTVMGLAAAVAVALAVSVALTLVPAVALLLGERLRPQQREAHQAGPRRGLRRLRPRNGTAATWVHLVTVRPVVTVLLVLGLLGLAAVPALRLDLALPDNSTAPESSAARQTYDGITAAFGEGYNAPLSLTADVITSANPKDTVADLAKAVAKVPGVVDVTQSTPNQAGDTGLVVAIPTAGQTSPSTSALVRSLRERLPGWEKQYDVSPMYVAGQTATNIDVSDRLAGALLPFGAIVMGLSLLLLMVVFRSIAVPIKATLGYLLSVGAALGAVVAVFQWGWLAGPLGLQSGAVVSFLPIFVMGVLFGLAMDYEMFLVSAMREAYVRTGDARGAVSDGFRASSRVVTAAALIMTSVFVAFFPGGSSTIKPISLGLAVGVFVDAFVVRMTLVPAVLMLLGRAAWWMPRWLDRRIPVVDVEGAALHRKVDFDRWEHERGGTAVLAEGVLVRDGGVPLDLVALRGDVTTASVPPGENPRVLGSALVGRGSTSGGQLVVGGLLLPEQRQEVLRAAAFIDLGLPPVLREDVRRLVEERARVSSYSRRRRREFVEETLDLVGRLAEVIDGGDADGATLVPAAAVEAALAMRGGARVLVLGAPEDPSGRAAMSALVDELAGYGLSVVVLDQAPEKVGGP